MSEKKKEQKQPKILSLDARAKTAKEASEDKPSRKKSDDYKEEQCRERGR